MNSIGSTLGAIRKDRGLTRKEVANKLSNLGIKISDKTLYGYESGRTTANADMFLALCKIYEVNDIFTTFGYDGYNEDGSLQLNLHEIDMIEKYRNLDAHGKEMVDFTLNKEYERSSFIVERIAIYSNPEMESEMQVAENASTYQPDESFSYDIDAAHTRTDIDLPDVVDTSDDDIMDDKDF